MRISVLLLGFLLAVFILVAISVINQMIIPGLWIMGGALLFVVFSLTGFRYNISGNKLRLKVWIIPMGTWRIQDWDI